MPRGRRPKDDAGAPNQNGGANLGFEKKLWQAADKLRGHMDAGECKHVVYILGNPPFNVSDWRGDLLKKDKRWKFGVPPEGNANFAWVQHMIHHLAPTGLADFVLVKSSMSSNQSGEGEIRKNIIDADLVDCMVALPGQLFYSTQIPVCLWFLARNRGHSQECNGWDSRLLPTGEAS